MRKLLNLLLLLVSIQTLGQTQLSFKKLEKQRLFVLTDITNEPDDQESLVRLLVYSNEFDVEGLVATTSTFLRDQVRKDKIEQLVKDYGIVRPSLIKHDSDYPTSDDLLSITKEHVPFYSMEGVGEDKDSDGSNLLINAVDKNDGRPLWVAIWGGANCLAQALWRVKQNRSSAEVARFVSKLRVYSISDQDFAGAWIRQTFPDIFYIVDHSTGNLWYEYYKATWTGIAGDLFYKNGPGLYKELISNEWLAENIRENHGPLGANYLEFEYIMEGDTPSFLGLIRNGLGWFVSPAYGGWAGRYDYYQPFGEKSEIWTSSVNTQDEIILPDGRIEASNQATIWRWREAYQHDFAARMDWNTTTNFDKVNHNPVVALNGNQSKSIGYSKVAPGQKVVLSAKGSTDPDGDKLTYKWFTYNEITSIKQQIEIKGSRSETATFEMPKLSDNQELHVILEVMDSGSPTLFSYRRVVLTH